MTNRSQIEERITKKEQEIQELEMKIREAKAYIRALQDVVKLMPGEVAQQGAAAPDSAPPTGSRTYISDAKDAIRKAGRPLHVVEIIKMSGRKNDRKTKIGIASSLAAYVRRGEVFTRPSPNTFGLVTLTDVPSTTAPASRSAPPPNFGLDEPPGDTNH